MNNQPSLSILRIFLASAQAAVSALGPIGSVAVSLWNGITKLFSDIVANASTLLVSTVEAITGVRLPAQTQAALDAAVATATKAMSTAVVDVVLPEAAIVTKAAQVGRRQ